jgi:hypothetical protein
MPVSIHQIISHQDWSLDWDCIANKLPSNGCTATPADFLPRPQQYSKITPTDINAIRAQIAARVTCFCKPGASPVTPWVSLEELMSETRTWDVVNNVLSATALIGNGAGLWTNTPARIGTAVYGATLSNRHPIYPEHWNELICACWALNHCNPGKKNYGSVLRVYRSCLVPQRMVAVMVPSDTIATSQGTLASRGIKTIAGGCGVITGGVVPFSASTFDLSFTEEDVRRILGSWESGGNGLIWDGECFYDLGTTITSCWLLWTCITSASEFFVLVKPLEYGDWIQYYESSPRCGSANINVLVDDYDISFIDPGDLAPSYLGGPPEYCKKPPCTSIPERNRYKHCPDSSGKTDVVYSKAGIIGGSTILVNAKASATSKLNNCYQFDKRVPATERGVIITPLVFVNGCHDPKCECCLIDLEILDEILEYGLKDRVKWLNGGVLPDDPWADTEYILNQDVFADKQSCRELLNYWEAIFTELELQIKALYTTGVWINADIHPNGDIAGATTVTYFQTSDFADGPTQPPPEQGIQAECDWMQEWLGTLWDNVQRLVGITINGVQTAVSYYSPYGAGMAPPATYADDIACIISNEGDGGDKLWTTGCVYYSTYSGPTEDGANLWVYAFYAGGPNIRVWIRGITINAATTPPAGAQKLYVTIGASASTGVYMPSPSFGGPASGAYFQVSTSVPYNFNPSDWSDVNAIMNAYQVDKHVGWNWKGATLVVLGDFTI